MTNLKPSFTLFDPTTPPPPLPPSEVERLTTTYAARPIPPQPPQRYVWIVTRRPDAETLLRARLAVCSAFKLACTNWSVLITHHEPASAAILDACDIYKVRCQCVSEARAWKLAAQIVALDCPELVRVAMRRGIPIYHHGWIMPPAQLPLPFAA